MKIEQWTDKINAIVNVLKIEMDGGFLENTEKYKDDSEEYIYSCLRAVASQILALIPDEKEIVRAEVLKEVGGRILSKVLSETFMDEGYVSVKFFQDTWEALKEGKFPDG